jgi:hypothetical protein
VQWFTLQFTGRNCANNIDWVAWVKPSDVFWQPFFSTNCTPSQSFLPGSNAVYTSLVVMQNIKRMVAVVTVTQRMVVVVQIAQWVVVVVKIAQCMDGAWW